MTVQIYCIQSNQARMHITSVQFEHARSVDKQTMAVLVDKQTMAAKLWPLFACRKNGNFFIHRKNIFRHFLNFSRMTAK
jgi:hypothetical protein